MFVKQIAQRVFLYNQDMKLINTYEDCVISKKEDRIQIVSITKGYVFCDMPYENTSILF